MVYELKESTNWFTSNGKLTEEALRLAYGRTPSRRNFSGKATLSSRRCQSSKLASNQRAAWCSVRDSASAGIS